MSQAEFCFVSVLDMWYTNQLGDADLIVNFCHREVKSEKLQVTRSSLPKPGVPGVEVSAINTFNCSLEFPVLLEPTLSQK